MDVLCSRVRSPAAGAAHVVRRHAPHGLAMAPPRGAAPLMHGLHKLVPCALNVERSTSPVGGRVIEAEELRKMRVVDLQEELKRMGLPKSGKKDILIERLITAVRKEELERLLLSQGDASLGASSSSMSVQEENPVAEAKSQQQQQQQATEEQEPGQVAGSQDELHRQQQIEKQPVELPREDKLGMAKEALARAKMLAQAKALEQEARAVQGSEGAPSTSKVALPFTRGTSWGLAQRHYGDMADLQQLVFGNTPGMILSFLGTSTFSSSEDRALASVALLRAKDVWVFDASDDIQRQINNLSFVRTSKVYRIFLTSLSSETTTGLPGLLLTCIASRTRGHELSDIPIHVYGPPGIAEFLSTMLTVSNAYIDIPILVNEFSFGPVEDEDLVPVRINARGKTYCVARPPDQLNPDGCIDGNLGGFMPTEGRASLFRGHRASGGVLQTDRRAEFFPFEAMPPGDPTRENVPISEMTWTIKTDDECKITAVALPGPRPALAYIVREADRAGQLMVDQCTALGVRPGTMYKKLKGGEEVCLENGTYVYPEQVLSPSRPGRIVAVLGTSGPGLEKAAAFNSIAKGADILVMGSLRGSSSTWDDDSSDASGLCTASEAGRVAENLGAQHVLLSRFDGRFHTLPHEVDPLVAELAHEVACEYKSGNVSAVHDYWTHIVEKHDGPLEPPPTPRVVWTGLQQQKQI